MNITTCPHCGGRVRSISIGCWKCENCQGFIDMLGQFHEYKEEPFMPPMIKVRIILKNGIEFVVTCKKAVCSHNNLTGEMTNFKYEGATKNIPLYLDVTQVAAVLQEEIETEEET